MPERTWSEVITWSQQRKKRLGQVQLIAVVLLWCVTCTATTAVYPRPDAWPIPTPQQLAYQGGISALIHFNMATFMHDGEPDRIRLALPVAVHILMPDIRR